MVPQDATPLVLRPSDATKATHACAGDEIYVLLGFDLVGRGAQLRGLTIRVEGPDLDELAIARIAVPRRTDVNDAGAPAGVPPFREDGALVAVFDDLELEPDNGFVLWLIGRPPRPGTFRFRVTVATTADDAELRATCEVVVDVLPMPRLPVLPTWVEDEWLLTVRDALARYDGREALEGWLAFDRPWDEIREIVTSVLVDLVAAIAVASSSGGGAGRLRAELDPYGRSRRFEGVTIARDPAPGTPWFVLLEALAKAGGAGTHGAHVVLHLDATAPATRIDLWHRRDGLKWSGWSDVACPEVELVWACPRPATDEAARALGRLGADVLARAGDVAGNLGGVVFSRESTELGWADRYMTPYETITRTLYEAAKPAYLARSVRSPGHRVLAPAAVVLDVDALPAGVEARRLAHGILLAAADDDPFTADRAPMERAVLPFVPQPSFDGAADGDEEADSVK